MKKYPALFIISLLSLSAFGQTDENSYSKAEKEINSVYQKILREYSADKAFTKNLKISQRLWIQFRDAEIATRYPNRTSGYYGSAHSKCVADLKTELTIQRIKTLRLWLEGIEEGDVCAGSVRRKR